MSADNAIDGVEEEDVIDMYGNDFVFVIDEKRCFVRVLEMCEEVLYLLLLVGRGFVSGRGERSESLKFCQSVFEFLFVNGFKKIVDTICLECLNSVFVKGGAEYDGAGDYGFPVDFE